MGAAIIIPKKSELTSMSNSCHCGRELKQNSIVLYCEDCGQFSEMSPYCPDHGIDSMYIIRGKMDNIATWKKLCKQCNNGGKGPETIFFKCKICGNVAKPLTVRDGGVISPVVLTFVDLEKLSTPERDKNEILRIIIKDEYITNNSLSKYIDVGNRSVQENIELLLAAEKNPFISVTEDVKVAVDYVKEVVEKVEESFKGIDIESINDIRSIIVNSKSYSDYILDSDVDIDYYYNCYEDICRKYSLKDIRYIPDLRLIQSCIGMINGINKFYESGFVPHFEPFKVRMSDPDIYSMVNPIITEGILFSLDPVRLCRWLFENNIVDCNYSSVEDCEKFILHMASDSSEYHAVKVVLHTFSHLLIKQSSLHTGLAEGTCSELLFINNGAFLIYSTSSVNIGGFDYAFKYSIPDWFREMNIAAEDCTFDPYCSEDGGRCFSCVFVQEHVCSEFNRDLSRLSLIGGGEYLVGLWNNED